ncbi:Na+/H+ antiporter NhaA [Streptomyces qaidamensis]|nr:Na+/H+ antiporter NhaA [Streptomyces qaidamensis]
MRTHMRDGERVSPSHQAEEAPRPFTAGIALPVFAVMSAGVSPSGPGGFFACTMTWGVLGGLLVGKFLGILGCTWLTGRFTSTDSLLIAELSYTGEVHLTDARGTTLLTSTAAALLTPPSRPPQPPPPAPRQPHRAAGVDVVAAWGLLAAELTGYLVHQAFFSGTGLLTGSSRDRARTSAQRSTTSLFRGWVRLSLADRT